MSAGDLITEPYQLELNGVLFGAGTKRQFSGPIEGFGIPDPRLRGSNRPAQHGAYPARQYLPAKSFTWQTVILGDDADDVFDELITAQSAFQPQTDGGELELVIRLTDLAYLYRGQPGQTAADLERLPKGAVAYLTCEFIATDPRAYSATEQTAETDLGASTGGLEFPHAFPHGFGSASPGLMVATNYGNVETFPTFLITAGAGGLVGPSLEALDPFAATLTVLISLDEGDELEVDMGAQTVTLNGTASRSSLVNRPTEDDWFAIPAGPGGSLLGGELSVNFTGTGAGHCVMSWRSANLI